MKADVRENPYLKDATHLDCVFTTMRALELAAEQLAEDLPISPQAVLDQLIEQVRE